MCKGTKGQHLLSGLQPAPTLVTACASSANPAHPGRGKGVNVEANRRHKLIWPPHQRQCARLSVLEGVSGSPGGLGQRCFDRLWALPRGRASPCLTKQWHCQKQLKWPGLACSTCARAHKSLTGSCCSLACSGWGLGGSIHSRVESISPAASLPATALLLLGSSSKMCKFHPAELSPPSSAPCWGRSRRPLILAGIQFTCTAEKCTEQILTWHGCCSSQHP